MDCVNYLSDCLTSSGWAPWLADLVSMLLGVVLVATVPLLTVILLIWVERKFAGRTASGRSACCNR
jgi:NADH:ubiquinone oxidoreductase subunit H